MPDFRGKGGKIFDRDAIIAALRLSAYRWVPEIFPQGKITTEHGNRVVRCADISGRPPRKQGSCVIQMEGDHAGDWHDFSTDGKGGPLSTLKEHFGLPERTVYEFAENFCEDFGVGKYLRGEPIPHSGNGKSNGDSRKAERDKRSIDWWISQSTLIQGTLAETYWNNRKLGPLPLAAFGSSDGSPDLMFNPNLSHWNLKEAFPSIIARFRYPWDFSWTGGIHRIYLERDGSWHIGQRYPGQAKMSMGPYEWGVITLAPVNAAGELGIGEGIETTATGMDMCGVPGWAVLGNNGMDKLAAVIASGRLAVAIKRLLIFGDRGRAGEGSAYKVAAAGKAAGMAVELYLPRGNDDLPADRAAGFAPPEPITDIPAEPPSSVTVGLPLGFDPLPSAVLIEPAAVVPQPYTVPQPPAASVPDLELRIASLSRGTSGDVLTGIVREIVGASLDPLREEALVTILYQRTGIKKATIVEMIRQLKGLLITDQDRRPERDWLTKVSRGNDGEPKPIMGNAAIILREAAELKGAIGFNEFTGMLWVGRKFPWERGYGTACDRPWTDDDELAVMEWIQNQAGLHARRGDIFAAVCRVAAEYKFHPVRDYLNAVEWDRVPRVDTFVIDYLGAADTKYNREIGARSLFAAVARIYRPGVKADCMTVLEGPQGQRKSSAIRILFDPNEAGWYTDQLSDIGTKDSSLELRGIWAAEHSELDAMTNADARTIKSYMSRTFDRFRPPYGRVPIRNERQCVFWGTSNESEHLKDPTGARRFWTIVPNTIDVTKLYHDRHLLWAEAVQRYHAKNAKWWIDDSDQELMVLAAEEAEARFHRDAWESIIEKWLYENEGSAVKWVMIDDIVCKATSTREILEVALQIVDKMKWGRSEQTRIGMIMKRLGWRKRRISMFNGPADWYYVKAREGE